MDEDAIVRQKLLVDERPLKRLIKRYYLWNSTCQSSVLQSSEVSPGDLGISFLLTLDEFKIASERIATMCKAQQDELQLYTNDCQNVQQEIYSLNSEINQLRDDLKLEEIDAKRKKEYDTIAQKILKFSTRPELTSRIQAEKNFQESERALSKKLDDRMTIRRQQVEKLLLVTKEIKTKLDSDEEDIVMINDSIEVTRSSCEMYETEANIPADVAATEEPMLGET